MKGRLDSDVSYTRRADSGNGDAEQAQFVRGYLTALMRTTPLVETPRAVATCLPSGDQS